LIESQKTIWYVIPLLPIALMFFISILAETNRAPFDLPEAESELVAGFMTEHSASVFVFFFLGEYSSLILMSALMTIFFLGGYLSPDLLALVSPTVNFSYSNSFIDQLYTNYELSLFIPLDISNSFDFLSDSYNKVIYTCLLFIDKFEDSFTFGFKVIVVVFLFI